MKIYNKMFTLFLLTLMSLFGCRGNKTAEEVKYLIGVSIADMREPWHLVLIDEMKKETEHHGEVRLIYLVPKSKLKICINCSTTG